MLLKNDYSIINRLKFTLTFDDDTVKSVDVKTNDIVDVDYNEDGVKTTIKGKITKIGVNYNSSLGRLESAAYIIIDGSGEYLSKRVTIQPSKILDIDVLETTEIVMNPVCTVENDNQSVILIKEDRLGYFSYSKDGTTWTSVRPNGEPGLSAYEVAVKCGFIGTEQEWIESMISTEGVSIKSVYTDVNDMNADTANVAIGKVVAVLLAETEDTSRLYLRSNDHPESETPGYEYLGSFAVGPKGEKGEKGDTGTDGIQGEQGLPGKDGEKGPKGDQGETGADGAKGDIGQQGETGATGPAGSDGEQGIPGKDGEQGPKGDPGTNGVDGAQGIQGSKGDPGTNGVDGAQGIQGPVGTPGTKGDPGTAGKDGAQGIQGPAGEDGIQGPKGDPGTAGAKGEKGDPGTPGLKGDTGEDGTAGAKGDTGAQGIQGPKGDPGTAGAKGEKGDTGVKGDPGTPGLKGDTGATGPAGTPGAKGDPGTVGAKGDTGAQGIQGPAGTKGETGATGPAGAKGDPGTAGKDGADAVIDDEAIIKIFTDCSDATITTFFTRARALGLLDPITP